MIEGDEVAIEAVGMPPSGIGRAIVVLRSL